MKVIVVYKMAYTDGCASCPTELPKFGAPERLKIKSCMKFSIGTGRFSCLLRLLSPIKKERTRKKKVKIIIFIICYTNIIAGYTHTRARTTQSHIHIN